MSGQDSWKNQYHAVEEFELPLERDRMLPSSPPPPPAKGGGVMSTSSSTSSSQQGFPPSSSTVHSMTSPRRNSRSFTSSPLNPQGTPSGSTTHSSTGRPSTSSGGSHTMHDSSKPLPRSPNSQSTLTAAASSSTPTPMPTSPFGRPGSRGSFTFSNTARSPSNLGMGPTSPMANGFSGTQTPTSELLAAHHSFGGSALPTVGSRGSMILYRRAESGLFSPPVGPGGFVGVQGHGGSGTTTPVQVPIHTGVSGTSGMSEDAPSHAGLLPPPALFSNNRASVYSTSGDSLYGTERGLVAYAYDPDEDDESDDEEGDWLHDPAVAYPGTKGAPSTSAAAAGGSGGSTTKGKGKPLPRPGVDPTTGLKITDPSHPLYIPQPYIAPRISWRGLINIGTLVAMVASLLCLFVVYPMVRFYADDGINARITGNLRINSTGQAEYFPGDDGIEEDGATPTTTRPPRTTVTSINEGGNIHDRREATTGILAILERAIVGSGSSVDVPERGLGRREEANAMWRREVDDWAVEFPVPSYNLKFFGGEGKVVQVVEAVVDAVEDIDEDQVDEQESAVKQVVHLCLPSTSIQKATKTQTQDELVARVEFVLGEGETKEAVGGWYQNGQWAFFPTPLPAAAAEEEELDDEWTLVKKQASDSPFTRLTLSLLDSSSSDKKVEVGRVEVFTPESLSGWVDARLAGEDGRCGGDDDEQQDLEVNVDVEDVLRIVQGRSASS